MNTTLFLMLGFSGSGKTTIAKMISQELGIPRISSDGIRRKMFNRVEDVKNAKLNPHVFGALDYAAEANLQLGISVIYDANNNRIAERAKSRAIADSCNAKTIIVWVKTPLAIAKKRELGRRADPNHLHAPEDYHDRLAAALQEPLAHELVIIIDGLAPAAEQLKSFKQQLGQIL